jgi:hypothetical protein
MNNQSTEFQDLTLDFIGGHEYLVLVPKSTSSGVEPASAIVAKKITSEEGTQSPQNENLDSRAYRISVWEKSTDRNNPTPFAEKINNALDRLETKDSPAKYGGSLILSKENLVSQFNIVGILNTLKLNEYLSNDIIKDKLEFNTYIDVFPEYQGQLSSWVNIS